MRARNCMMEPSTLDAWPDVMPKTAPAASLGDQILRQFAHDAVMRAP
jgi:hypothetical protein